LTVTLDKGYGFNSTQEPLIKKIIDVKDGFYEGDIKLPTLEPGGYNLEIKHDDTLISSMFVKVYNYTKPSYKIDITKDKKAIFPGQEVNFGIKSSFFEGTGVANLKVDYFIDDYFSGIKNGSGTTDTKGNINVKYTPELKNKAQGEQQVRLNIRATLPESGEINQSDYVRVFSNDINVNLSGEIKDKKGSITANINKITLDRLNNGSAKDDSDYLGDPVNNKTISGTIYKNTWVQKEDGDYYDFINKVTRKRYRYDLVKDAVKAISMTSSADGKALYSFDVEESNGSYYTAELNCADESGREMNFEIYLSQHYDFRNYPADDNYILDGGKDSYSIGENIELALKKGNSQLPDGSYLFIKAQNGIRNYSTSNKPLYSDIFNKNDMPDTSIKAVY
ncbi:MAG: alpha-2-macroglobulin, partial [Bacillota bacterium]|nr:alpha-2-macroglobulin [Bacillota bacterium]